MSDESVDPAAGPPVVRAGYSLRSEPELRAAVLRRLERQGVPLAARLVCVVGEPDIVTAAGDAIYEVKYRLTRKALFQALGQILLYRQAINPAARAVIVGYATPETLTLRPYVGALDVELWLWDDREAGARDWGSGDGGWGSGADGVEERATALTTPTEAKRAPDQLPPLAANLQPPIPDPSPTLRWNIAALAQAQGLRNVPALAARMEVSRQGLYPIWKGEAAQVSLTTLARLALALGAEVGDWFAWDSGARERRLSWAIAAQASARDVEPVTLGFRAGLHPGSMQPIWQGEAQAVAVETLGRLALALDGPNHPFRIGDLFTWHAPPREA